MTRASSPIRIEVVHLRDPDSECGMSVYVNGQPVDELSNVTVSFYDLDCGAGRDFRSLVDTARYDHETASPRVWSELASSYADPPGSEYVEDWPDEWPNGDDDWLSHLDEPDDSPYWRAVWDESGNG